MAATVGNDLVVEGLTKSFGSTPVLHGVTLTVRAGEFLTLLGPSGCGKTTLLRIVAGLESADSGVVRLGDWDLGGVPANRRPVNTVFQSYALFPHLSVEGNVMFGLRAQGVARRAARERAGRAMEMLRLGELAGRKPGQLSGGQRQRVALARALVCEPEVLLLDEPMSALDAQLRAEVQGELRRLQRRTGKSFVLVTHDQDEAMGVSDRIVVMNRGMIEQEGTPAEVYERPKTRFVAEFLGAANVVEGLRVGEKAVWTPWGVWATREAVLAEKVWVGVRPERVTILDSAADGALVDGAFVVEEMVFRGDHRELRLGDGRGNTLKVKTGRVVEIGERVAIHIEVAEVLEA